MYNRIQTTDLRSKSHSTISALPNDFFSVLERVIYYACQSSKTLKIEIRIMGGKSFMSLVSCLRSEL